MDKFVEIVDKINNYSHAYIVNTNDIDRAYNDCKYLAKKIIVENNDGNLYSNEDICERIDNDSFDDLYVLKNDNLSIKVDEINDLMLYFNTKSLRNNGRRVYIIVGIEKIRNDFINKLLKFIEDPPENLYCILITSEFDNILSTIVSRCQKLNCIYDNDNFNNLDLSFKFFDYLYNYKLQTITYVKYIFDIELTKENLYNFFENNENILNNIIHKKQDLIYNHEIDKLKIINYDLNKIMNMLSVTSYVKSMLKYNLNINLLIDRYIIELERGKYE